MSIDSRVMAIADAAKEGQAPSRDDVVYLLGFDGYSPEAAYVGVRAREIAVVSSGASVPSMPRSEWMRTRAL